MKKTFDQEILVIAILTLAIAILWAYLSVYRAFNKSEKPILSPEEIQMLNPKLDSSIFEELKKGKI